MPTIQFHNNGTTSVYSDTDEVLYGLNIPWINLYANYLCNQGENPDNFRLILPNNKEARFFRSPNGWCWEIIEK